MSEAGGGEDPVRARPWLRWLVIAIVAVAVLALLFEVVFPWVERTFYNPTMG